MRSFRFPVLLILLCEALLLSHAAMAQFRQQGPKLVGTGAVGMASQGISVALSDDGNTAIVGALAGPGADNGAWVFTRSGGVWTQQGAKLFGSGGVGVSSQGRSVALSADGNTAIIGGPGDNGGAGAAWVFTRSGGIWTQQGAKLVGTGAAGIANQGSSVAVSADGNTAIIGGPGDNGGAGAAWVFTRSGEIWTQQAAKLVGTGAVGVAGQGHAVALSIDGNTGIVGGPYDNDDFGAAWVFTRSGGAWTQQGPKLIGSGAAGAPEQGSAVALSANGNTAIVGGPYDGGWFGAAWVFTRSGGVWAQQGAKLFGTDYERQQTGQGNSVAVSADGNTAIVGGPYDHGSLGAAWVFLRSEGIWTQPWAKLVSAGSSGAIVRQGEAVALSGNGNTAIVGGPGDNWGFGAAWVFTRAKPLSYTPVTPCRLADTRVAVGPLLPRAARAFSATQSSMIAATGGNPLGCGIPAGPTGLALTLTVVLPPQVGNLVAYADGGAIPLASALNFLAGQIIANTTIVPSTPTLGPNFDIYNNSDGATHVVVDAVGYFWEHQASDCTKVSQSQSLGAGGTAAVQAVCSIGYAPLAGGCSADTAEAVNWLDRRNTGNDLGYACTALNRSAGPINVTTDVLCCRKAGR